MPLCFELCFIVFMTMEPTVSKTKSFKFLFFYENTMTKQQKHDSAKSLDFISPPVST